MTEILVVLDKQEHPEQVRAEAEALAGTLGVAVRPLLLPDEGDLGTQSETVLTELARDETLLLVMAGAPEGEGLCWQVVTSAQKPVLLVPPVPEPSAAETEQQIGQRVERKIDRVLLPLDGTEETAAAVTEAVGLLSGAGVTLIALHVFDSSTVPAFWDQAAHTGRAWTEEFLARNIAERGVELEVRAGRPEREVSSAAVGLEADMLLMGWSQHVEPERAATVRSAVLEGTVPVLLVPLSPAAVR